MDETILFPSPNWFQPSGIAVSTDEWIVYGGPTKSLCVLEPLPPENDTVIKGRQAYTAHVVNRAHPDKIVCVDLCPEWPERRNVLTGSSDGAVKQWNFERTEKTLNIKSTHSHEMHSNEKEEVVGVGYCKDGYAVTIGNFGHIVKWDLNSNVAKSFNNVLKTFRPTTMACSPHLHMYVAIGTKQGVLFVLDLNGYPRIVYKVRGQDDEILKVSWCPQYEVAVRKALKEVKIKNSAATQRLENIRQEPETPEKLKQLDDKVKNSETTDKPILINENSEPVTDAAKAQHDESGMGKTLPEDSFDESAIQDNESIVQEDDMFDIYKDHEADEFGHKKFQPIDVMVKVPTETVKDDYLADCLKLKDEILKRKAESDTTIGELVDAMDKTKLDTKPEEQASTSSTGKPTPSVEGRITKGEVESSVHIHKHLLATISKQGGVRVWSKSGKLVGSSAVYNGNMQNAGKGKGAGGGGRADKRGYVSTLVWATPDLLLLGDGNNHVLDCNPLKIDCKNKMQWKPMYTLHTRGMFAIAVNTPRVQEPSYRPDDVVVWSAAQDRSLVRYSVSSKQHVTHMTCGGYIYSVSPCPYDARRVAVAVGDGNIRVWEADTLQDDETKLSTTRILNYWQNVMGKVLVTAWHPERENLLAFSTAESRVGVLECTGREKPAKVLHPEIAGGIYSLCFSHDSLFACGNGCVARYSANKLDQTPTQLSVEFEGKKWEVSTIQWYPHYIAVGSNCGTVGVMTQDFKVVAAAFVFKKMIHTVAWHPRETTLCSEPSPYQNLLAACSLAKVNTVVILQFTEKDDGAHSLTTWKTLSGHSDTVLQVMWSPHKHHQLLSTSQDGAVRVMWSPHKHHQLLSTSQDGTVRIWDVTAGVCTNIFGGHVTSSIGASWSAWPSLPDYIVSGGGDCALRLWNIEKHPADKFQAIKYEVSEKKTKRVDKRRDRKEKSEEQSEEREEVGGGGDAGAGSYQDAIQDGRLKRKQNKKFLLPILDKQMTNCSVAAPRRMLQMYLQRHSDAAPSPAPAPAPSPAPAPAPAADEHGTEFINIFGNINEVNALLDGELERHEDTGGEEAWLLLNILRGYIDACIQRAARRDQLDPFLLTIAPAVSFKYWKDATMLYLQQIERLNAKGEEHKLLENKPYGGAVFRRVCALLSLHDVKGAVAALTQHKLYKEAYVLSRARYMDSLATAVLREWAQCALVTCQWNLSAVCHIALGDLAAAADALSKSSDEGSLSLAADIASSLGRHTFAAHVHGKREQIKTIRDQEQLADKELKELPNKVDALLNALKTDDTTDENKQVNGSKHETNNNEAKEVQEMDEDIKKIEDEAKQMQDAAKELKHEAKEVEDEANELKDVVQEILEEVKQMKDLVKQEIKDVDKSIKNDVQSLKDATIENVKNVSKDETKGLKDKVTEVPKIKEKTLRELLEQKLEDLEYDDDDATNKTELLVEKMERLMKQPSAAGPGVGAGGAHDDQKI